MNLGAIVMYEATVERFKNRLKTIDTKEKKQGNKKEILMLKDMLATIEDIMENK